MTESMRQAASRRLAAEAEKAEEEAAPREATGPGRGRGAAAGLLAVTGAVALAAPLVVAGAPLPLLAVLAAVLASLSCPRVTDAAAIALLGAIAGFALMPLVTTLRFTGALAWVPPAVAVGAGSALLASLSALAAARAPRMRSLLVVTGLLAVLGLAWLSATSAATAPGPSGPSLAQELTPEPTMTATTTDEGVYLIYVRRLQSGQAYYPMVARTLTQGNAVRVGGRVDRSRPTSFRLPTLYALLAALPPYGISLVLAMMVLGSAAAVAAFALASRFAPPALALLGALAVAVFYYGEATRYALLGTEPWAGGLILVAASLAVWAPETRKPLLAHCAAAAAALAAASLRELAAPFVGLGLAASLLQPTTVRRRAWMPWAAAAILVGAGYGAHWSAAAAVIRDLGLHDPPATNSWFHPAARGLVAVFARVGGMTMWRPPTALALLVLASAGAALAPRRTSDRLLLATTVAGGAIVVAFLYPGGVALGTGLPPGYWGDVVMPVVLACAPIGLTLATGTTRRDASPDVDAGAIPVPDEAAR